MKRVPRGAFFLSSSDVRTFCSIPALAFSCPETSRLIGRKSESEKDGLHRKSIGIPRGLPSNSYEAITDGKLAVSAGKKAELTLNSTAL